MANKNKTQKYPVDKHVRVCHAYCSTTPGTKRRNYLRG